MMRLLENKIRFQEGKENLIEQPENLLKVRDIIL